ERLGWIERDGGRRAISVDRRPVRRRRRLVEKRTVAYELGVQPAVIGVVDLLRHQTIKKRTDLARWCGCVDRDDRRRSAWNGRGKRQRHGQPTCLLTL